MTVQTKPIPQPTGLPFLGNVTEIDPEFPLGSTTRLAETYGEIFSLNLAGRRLIWVNTRELGHEVCDEKRFEKLIGRVLGEVRNGVKDGLFTAYPGEHNWGVAHRILIPAFGPLSVRELYSGMYDIATQLVMKWARAGPDEPIHVTDDFTRLALDTLALCSMDYRFNSYYKDEMHPFISAMGDFLTESGRRGTRPPFANNFYRSAQRKYDADIEILQRTAEDVVKYRKSHPSDLNDLLQKMIEGVDPKSGDKMSDELIAANLVTFLIAGHETTSGLLSFTFYFFLKHPEAFHKAQNEVDEVVGRGRQITVEHLTKLPYINAALRESLRMAPTITGFTVTPLEDTIIGGKYEVKKGDAVTLNLAKIHTDPAVYGDDADQWKPERMLDENFNKLPPGSWKPFGNGVRACIGRPFAWQEALLTTALLLQNFNFTMDDPSYNLSYKQTLTIKPNGFFMHATLREGLTATKLDRQLSGSAESVTERQKTHAEGKVSKAGQAAGRPMSIFYGSNTGTCEAFASRLGSAAASHGFQADVRPLDTAKENLKPNQPTVLISASYEGEPPDNAQHFVTWLKNLNGKELENVPFAVFGCGHQDWVQTYQKIPTLIDERFEALGGKRFVERGSADAAQGDMFSDFESWEDDKFWPAVQKTFGAGSGTGPGDAAQDGGVQVEVSNPRASLRQDVREGRVISNTVLTAPGAPEKMHVEIELPTGMTYNSGDYLAILPLNHKENVDRAMRYFRLSWDSTLTIGDNGSSILPQGIPLSARDVFFAYIELMQPASKRNVATLMEWAQDPSVKENLDKLRGDNFSREIVERRVSVLDLLERFPSITLPLGTFLGMMAPMRIRQYSISSSPLWSATRCTLTYGVLSAPSLSGSNRTYYGAASNHLASLSSGDVIHVAVKPSHSSFHLPSDPEKTPVIMVAAGTGLAPFRGFVQERAAQAAAGRNLAPALLILGCRAPDEDALHAGELDRWERAGAVRILRAFSRRPDDADGCKYVQDRLWHDRADAVQIWDQGAKFYLCGSGAMGEGVRRTMKDIWIEAAKEKHQDEDWDWEQRAEEWFQTIKHERYAVDVFT